MVVGITKIAVGVGAVAAAAVAGPAAVTLAVSGEGFGATGITAGSWASGLMASYGGTVAAGSLCAVLQSIGAAGLATKGILVSSAAAAGVVATGFAANLGS